MNPYLPLPWLPTLLLASLPLVASLFLTRARLTPTMRVWVCRIGSLSMTATLAGGIVPVSVAAAGGSGPAGPTPWIVPALTAIWALGVLVVLADLAQAARKASLLIGQAQFVSPAELSALRSAFPMPITVKRSAGIASPILVRTTSHFLLLPQDFDLTEGHPAIVHEAAHCRHRDLGWLRWHRVIAAVVWFNPLIWMLERELMLAQEIRADEVAVRSARSAATYAQAILNCAGQSVAGWNAIAFSSSAMDLKQRIQLVLEPRRSAAWTWLLLVLLLPLFMPIRLSYAAQPQPEPAARRAVGAPAPGPFATMVE